MAATGKTFRFVRRAARAQWYLGPRFRIPLLLFALGAPFLFEAQDIWLAWMVVAMLVVLLVRADLRERKAERAFWECRARLEVGFWDGRLVVRSGATSQDNDLSDVLAIDAVEERGRIVRLLVDRPNGVRDIYAGFDDMESFATEFRLNAPTAKYRRVRLGFPMRLKEV